MKNRKSRELVENEEQGKNKKTKSIVVEEQEQEEGSETRFVDLDQDTLRNVLKRVDKVTLLRAGCVNKLWRKVGRDKQLWKRFCIRHKASSGRLRNIDKARRLFPWLVPGRPLPDFIRSTSRVR